MHLKLLKYIDVAVVEYLVSTSIREISPALSGYSLDVVFTSDTFASVIKSNVTTLRRQSFSVTINKFLHEVVN